MIILAFFAFPLMLYCLVLGMINRRGHPVMVHGSWDCLGLLLGLSGVLLVGGPALFTALYHREVREFLLGGLRWGEVPFEELLGTWWRIWLLYFLAVLAAAGFLLWWRARVTVIYNVDPLAFDHVLNRMLDRLGLEWTRLGNRVFIGFRGGLPQPLPTEVRRAAPLGYPISAGPLPGPKEERAPALLRAEQEAVLDVDPFFATHHVTLVWRSSRGRMRQEIEADLARELLGVLSRDNPVGSWLLGIASALFFLLCLGVGLYVLLQLRGR